MKNLIVKSKLLFLITSLFLMWSETGSTQTPESDTEISEMTCRVFATVRKGQRDQQMSDLLASPYGGARMPIKDNALDSHLQVERDEQERLIRFQHDPDLYTPAIKSDYTVDLRVIFPDSSSNDGLAKHIVVVAGLRNLDKRAIDDPIAKKRNGPSIGDIVKAEIGQELIHDDSVPTMSKIYLSTGEMALPIHPSKQDLKKMPQQYKSKDRSYSYQENFFGKEIVLPVSPDNNPQDQTYTVQCLGKLPTPPIYFKPEDLKVPNTKRKTKKT